MSQILNPQTLLGAWKSTSSAGLYVRTTPKEGSEPYSVPDARPSIFSKLPVRAKTFSSFPLISWEGKRFLPVSEVFWSFNEGLPLAASGPGCDLAALPHSWFHWAPSLSTSWRWWTSPISAYWWSFLFMRPWNNTPFNSESPTSKQEGYVIYRSQSMQLGIICLQLVATGYWKPLFQ